MDNTTINPGVGGDVIATDDISGVKYPLSKIILGADGINGGMVDAANPLPVSLDGASLTVDGAVTANAGTDLNTSALALEAGGNLAALAASASVLDDWDSADACKVGGFIATPSASFARPGNTTQYTSGDLVANNAAAGSVAPMSFAAARVAAGSGMVRRARLKKTTTTTVAATFRLHLYGASPTVTNGDNGAWLSTQSGYLGSIDLDMAGANGRIFSDGAQVIGAPVVGSEIGFLLPSGVSVYGLLEARDVYSPGSGETFTLELEIIQN